MSIDATLKAKYKFTDEVFAFLSEHFDEYVEDWKFDDFMLDIKVHSITSPPEQLFLAAWCIAGLDLNLEPQSQIGKYRADFTICAFDHFVNTGYFKMDIVEKIIVPRYAIEIDGHQWHDKTPAQAEHDRKRDRFIQSQGYQVLRFAAREVFRDPFECMREVKFRIKDDIVSVYNRLTLQ